MPPAFEARRDLGQPRRDGLAPGPQREIGAGAADQRKPHRGDGDRVAHVKQQARSGLQIPELRGRVPLAEPGRGRVPADGERRQLRIVAVGRAGRAERRHAGRGESLGRHGTRRGRGTRRRSGGRGSLSRAGLDGWGAGRRQAGTGARRGGTRAGGGGCVPVPAYAGDELVAGEAEDRQHQHGQEGRPAHSPPLALPQRHARLEGLRRRDFLRGSPRRVELVNQRHGILPHGAGDGADMAPRIEVTAARSVVILLYTPDDGLCDTGAVTDLADGQPGPAAGCGQRRADAHARLLAPPGLIPFV